MIEKKLVIDTAQTKNLILIFEKYLELKSVIKLQEFLKQENILTRTGKNWTTGTLYELLARKVYLGLLPHKDQIYDGLHEAIISKDLFDQAQALLKLNNKAHKVKSRAEENGVLAGLIFDEKGNKFYLAHSTKKNGKRYRYYKSKSLVKHRYDELGEITQISAQIIENLVFDNLCKLLKSKDILKGCSIDEWNELNEIQNTISLDKQNLRELYLKLINKVVLRENFVEIHRYEPIPILKALFYKRDLSEIDLGEAIQQVNIPILLSKTKDGATAIMGSSEKSSESISAHILATVKQGFQYSKLLQNGTYKSAEQIAKSMNKDGKYIRLIMSLRFLAPRILEAILNQQIPSHWTLKLLFETSKFDNWEEQIEFVKF